MLIDRLELKKKGVGWIVLLAATLLASIPALVLICLRLRRLRLRETPQVRLFGKIPFGNALIWGLLIFTVGFLMCLVGFGQTRDDPAGKWILWLFFVPNALTGCLLSFYWAYYRIYRAAMEVLLERIGRNDVLSPEDMRIIVMGTTYKPARTALLLADLQEMEAIGYEKRDGGSYAVWITSPELAACFEARRSAGAPREKTVSWNCTSCGAPNVTSENGACAYCGAGRPM